MMRLIGLICPFHNADLVWSTEIKQWLCPHCIAERLGQLTDELVWRGTQ